MRALRSKCKKPLKFATYAMRSPRWNCSLWSFYNHVLCFLPGFLAYFKNFFLAQNTLKQFQSIKIPTALYLKCRNVHFRGPYVKGLRLMRCFSSRLGVSRSLIFWSFSTKNQMFCDVWPAVLNHWLHRVLRICFVC